MAAPAALHKGTAQSFVNRKLYAAAAAAVFLRLRDTREFDSCLLESRPLRDCCCCTKRRQQKRGRERVSLSLSLPTVS